jgi:cobalt-zinc-cadmium efflux system outer membrane protein
MKRIFPFLPISVAAVLLLLAPGLSSAQQSLALTWDQVKAKFEAANPALRADALGVDEMKAAEITAFLRPNPTASFTMDQLYPFGAHYDPNVPGVRNRPLSNALTTGSVSYLYEREHKRDLRLESAKEGTQIAGLQHQDLERNLLFNLRAAFVDTLQAKAVLDLARADLEYYDKIIAIRSIWTASSCCASNMKWRFRTPLSTCAPPRFSFCNCSTNARRWSSSM